jgi:hypothetical protein
MNSNYIDSDQRIKCNICTIPTILDKLEQIKFVSYDRIYPNATHSIGVIAQELQSIFPELISTRIGHVPNMIGVAEHFLVDDDIVFIQYHYDISLTEGMYVEIYIQSARINYNRTLSLSVFNPTGVSFEVKKWEYYDVNDKITVIGTQVEDLCSVNVTELSLLGPAGVKELYQIVKEQAATINVLKTDLQEIREWAKSQGFKHT